MGRDTEDLPPGVERHLRLAALRNTPVLDTFEAELFEWHSREHSKLIDEMVATERAFVEEQASAGSVEVNDSGIVAVEYYIKRARYSDVIYLASLLEGLLKRACATLRGLVDGQVPLFQPEELKGDKWSRHQKFLDRYGRLSFPEPPWADLRTMVLVRNNLVHANGDTSALSEEEKSRIRKQPGITVDSPEVVIEARYVEHALAAFKSIAQFVSAGLADVASRAERPRAIT